VVNNINDQNKNNQQSAPNTNLDTGGIGKNMMIIACIIAIALATWFFGNIEENRYNPNQSPASFNEGRIIKVELQRNQYGHYVTTGMIDNKEVVFLLDTGATYVAIPSALESYLNLKRGQSYFVHTANGTAKVYDTEIDYLQIGDIVLDNVKASISPTMQGEEVLLGMSALKQIEFRQKGDFLTLIQQKKP